MAVHTPQRYLYSLRIRYAIVAFLFALVIVISTALAYQGLSSARQSISSRIENRNQVQLRTRYIRDAIWHAHEALQLFLFNPNKERYQAKIHSAIDHAIAHSKYLITQNKNMPDAPRKNIRQLHEQLISLNDAVKHLIQVRITAIEQYPSLKLAMGTMLELNNEFVSAASLAIDESLENSVVGRYPVTYSIMIQARHNWTQIMSNFRMYLANRLGTFDNRVFNTQTSNIETQYASLQKLLQTLRILDDNEQLDLQASSSTRIMLLSASTWYKEYKNVRLINESNFWRTDALLFSNEVTPLQKKIWHHLMNIDLDIERTAEQDVRLLTRIAQYQLNSLGLAAGLAVLFVIISYLLLDKSVFRPLSALTLAIKAEAHGEEARSLPSVKTLETQHLLDAFTEMRKQIHHRQTALEYQALHDSLTGLANRTLLMDRLQQGIQHCTRHKTTLSLLIIDLDGFKEVNDTLGHQVGDRLLEQVGRRLSSSLRNIDTVARLGGDEFAILLPDDSESEATEVARKILHLLGDPFFIQETELYVSASIGIATYPVHAQNVQELIKFADIAMYAAKRNKQGYAIYDKKHNIHSLNQLSLGTDLRNALGSTDIQLVYQPKLNVHTRELVGVEALFRWNHERLGNISPTKAIELAEQNGLIHQLTMWTTEEVTRQLSIWGNAGIHIPVSINLSVYSLQNQGVMDYILAWIESSNIDASMFIFEITESVMMVDHHHAIETMHRISRTGAKISIDDFGTGFSSLTYLKQMPVNELKIDKSFVIDMLENDNDAIIVRSIIDLAHNIGLKVVAEGVEDIASWQLLQILNCDIVQGNYLCPPIPAGEFLAWHRRNYPYEPLLDSIS